MFHQFIFYMSFQSALINFSRFFCSLTKDFRNRPKYPELLESDFFKMYENADVDVATWFASVMHTNNQQQPNEPRR